MSLTIRTSQSKRRSLHYSTLRHSLLSMSCPAFSFLHINFRRFSQNGSLASSVRATARLQRHAHAHLRSVANSILLTYVNVVYSCCGHSGCRGCRGCCRLGCSECHGHQSPLDFFEYSVDFIEQIPSIRFHRVDSSSSFHPANSISIVGLAL